jgi:hypothetical protein
MCKRLLIGLASTVVVALSAMPAVAQATPRWFINSNLAGAKPEGVASWGTLTLENHFIGKLRCETIMYGGIYNEKEAGRGHIESYTGYGCAAEPTSCPGAFITDEKPLEVKKETGRKPEAVRVVGPLPWSGELLTETENQKELIIHPLLTVVLP